MAIADIPTDRSALLVMHYQKDVFDLVFGEQTAGTPEHDALVAHCNGAIRHMRDAGRPVIFANFVIRDRDEIGNRRNRLIQLFSGTGRFKDSAPLPGLEWRPDDPIYACPRASIFQGTTLDWDLRAWGIERLVMAGVASSGVVLSSLAWASDADYEPYLLRNGCYDPDAEAHAALFRTGFATRATII